jgi:hypothetical protein
MLLPPIMMLKPLSYLNASLYETMSYFLQLSDLSIAALAKSSSPSERFRLKVKLNVSDEIT